ncbi:hypothetical protein MF271_18990 (plasmid) [Deinococcus sp. KNUC1210]|uniref:hypothetical protein n=1 Tax=Deinococcus sp. KNUC1210 TaxID=2917691 RepID=UPI001EF0B32F|nr:hypothetical protein [Deinococcus sp. KNUC1210]ULH17408.1 hypothetical protein MF271_18990 [Deinococcus sp. KNUC1210]
MIAHSTGSQSDDDRQFEAFMAEGLVKALYYAVQDGCSEEFAARNVFADPNINLRARGDNRWHWVDQMLLHMAPLFGFEPIWIPTGISGHPRMLMLKRGNLVISAHQVKTYRRAPDKAKYRLERMRQRGVRLLYTLDELVESVFNPAEELRYWMLTYQQTKSKTPKWVVLGIPERGQRDLAYARDLGQALGIVHPSEIIIELNPQPQAPKREFNPPRTDKQEGEGEN